MKIVSHAALVSGDEFRVLVGNGEVGDTVYVHEGFHSNKEAKAVDAGGRQYLLPAGNKILYLGDGERPVPQQELRTPTVAKRRYAKIFYENNWYEQQADRQYHALTDTNLPLESQVNKWVDETGSTLLAISQPGISIHEIAGNTSEDPNRRCISKMVAVIYEKQ